MAGLLQEISQLVVEFGSAPKLEEMPTRTLLDKGINGPTAAHTIEEIHTPLNLAYVTFTTGSSAMQNIVGITFAELPERIKASKLVLKLAGLKAGDKVLVTYPPLVNVFSGQAIKEYGLSLSFLIRSSRDAFLAALYEEKPVAVIGESSFLRAAFEDAKNMGVIDELPKNLILLTAGTPLDLELLPIAEEVLQAKVHDLYGCQEFGWLAMDGCLVRDDISLVPLVSGKGAEVFELVVGGLPTGDSFPVSESGHVCNHEGKIITYRRQRTYPEFEVILQATKLSSSITAERAARSILRIKGRIVKISPDLETNSKSTVLALMTDPIQRQTKQSIIIKDAVKTKMFDDLIQAQLDYQQNSKADPVWKKRN